MVVCSPCKALIETAKLTIDLILTYILDLTLPPSCRRSRLSVCAPESDGHCAVRPLGDGLLIFLASWVWPLFMQTKQGWPSLNLKNRSLIFSRWDDLITHESQRKAENWMTGSGRETKLAIYPLPLHYLHKAPGLCFLHEPMLQGGGQGKENVKFLLSWHSACNNSVWVKGIDHLRSAFTELPPNANTRVASRQMT